MKTGWQNISDKWYYMNNNGVMVTGTQTINNKTYYFSNNGTLQSDTNKIELQKSISIRDIAIALAVEQAYSSAKYPSTLHVGNVYYKENYTNGYGHIISRLVLRCYAMNGFGGYSDFYIVVINVPNDDMYNNEVDVIGSNFIISVYDSNPSTSTFGTVIDNKIAEQAYKTILGSSAKNISFDE